VTGWAGWPWAAWLFLCSPAAGWKNGQRISILVGRTFAKNQLFHPDLFINRIIDNTTVRCTIKRPPFSRRSFTWRERRGGKSVEHNFLSSSYDPDRLIGPLISSQNSLDEVFALYGQGGWR
jgi:hypothetical protein